MKIRTNIAKLVLLICLLVLPISWSQMSNRDKVYNYIDAVRNDLVDGKIGIILGVMELSDEEAEIFWQLYFDYEYELFDIGDRRVELIERFITAHRTNVLDDLEAKKMAAEWFKQEADRIGLLKKYYELIANKVSVLHAIQFLQVEHRVNTVIDLMIASELPLFKRSEVTLVTN
ncbi:MAG: hypothetical protein ACYSTT_10755 [Planctomycetota bacterium]|jgi:hypothetical protein